jgi:hypothetical protein
VKVPIVVAKLSKVYEYRRAAGIAVKPNEGISGAISRKRSAKRGMSCWNISEEFGNPCNSSSTGECTPPASR